VLGDTSVGSNLTVSGSITNAEFQTAVAQAAAAQPAFNTASPLEMSLDLGTGDFTLQLQNSPTLPGNVTVGNNLVAEGPEHVFKGYVAIKQTPVNRPNVPSEAGIYMGQQGGGDYAIDICAANGTKAGYFDFTIPNQDFRGRFIYFHGTHRFQLHTALGEALRITQPTLLANGYGSLSDESLKENVAEADEEACLAMLRGVAPKTYERTDMPGQRLGFIAQDLSSNCPPEFANICGEADNADIDGHVDEDQPRLQTVDYARLSAVLWGVCRNLDARLRALEALK
jgi:hypothetical protein